MLRLSALFAVVALISFAPARSQSLRNLATFQEITVRNTSSPEWMIDGDPGTAADFRQNELFEARIRAVDAEGQRPFVIGIGLTLTPQSGITFYSIRVELKEARTNQWIRAFEGDIWTIAPSTFGSLPLSLPLQATEFRLTSRSNLAGSPRIAEFHLLAEPGPRLLELDAWSWRYLRPTAGRPASFGYTLHNSPTDDIALLFMNVNAPLLAAPIRLGGLSQGGLLIDPTGIIFLDSRIVSGSSAWRRTDSFLYDPAAAGIDIHLQGLILDLIAPGTGYTLWSNPVTLTL